MQPTGGGAHVEGRETGRPESVGEALWGREEAEKWSRKFGGGGDCPGKWVRD